MRGQCTWRLALVASAAAAIIAARPARAAIVFDADNGWRVSFDGFVNAFGANEIGSRAPGGAVADPLMTSGAGNSFRVRTGLLPGMFAFNVAAPPADGLKLNARVGLYPQIQNGGTRNAFGSQIDLREIFFTVDGWFGQVLAGRALNLYQGKNILTDMSLFGVGAQGPISAGGTTLGRIGYGYVYSQFGAQLRYTTPAWSGAKLAVAVVDPSRIAGAGVAATDTKLPALEAELSWAGPVGPAELQAWVSGLEQRAEVPETGADKTAWGAAGGVGAKLGAAEALLSGFGGRALGSFFLLDTDSLDATGRERDSLGLLAQASYRVLGKTKLGVSFGQNTMRETSAEEAARRAGDPSQIETRRSYTGGVYHDVNAQLRIVGEVTHATTGWFGGQDQAVDVVALGGFFFW